MIFYPFGKLGLDEMDLLQIHWFITNSRYQRKMKIYYLYVLFALLHPGWSVIHWIMNPFIG